MTVETTVIHCNRCRARVQANLLAEREYPPTGDEDPYKYVFAECTHCKGVLVGLSAWVDFVEDPGWTYPERQWPEPEDPLHRNIPRSVRNSLQEAQRCLSSQAYMATAVMCGRAVEALCQEKTKAKSLADGLNKLREGKIIDEKLFEWSEALRKERNIGAHAGEVEITPQDAKDVLDFAIAISEYVYVLDEKYKAYLVRKGEA
jgi:Domain of unknown function (DUF4145)